MLNQLPTILFLILANLIGLAFVIRREPWAVLAILAQRLDSIVCRFFSITFRDDLFHGGTPPTNRRLPFRAVGLFHGETTPGR
jgi:hypothetical protein